MFKIFDIFAVLLVLISPAAAPAQYNEATFYANRMTVMPFFAKWLKTNILVPERIYGFHSTMFGTMEHIKKILKLSADKAQY